MTLAKLKFEDICNLFSKRCSLCNGSKFIIKNGCESICPCQVRANIKWKFEQIEVFPSYLKYKNWKDFTGIIGENEIVGSLTTSSLKNARKSALKYCFNKSEIPTIESRFKNLSVHHHLNDGQNVVIFGEKQTGKTLLAVLIIKEVVWASSIYNKNITFKWCKFDDIIESSRWDNSYNVDYDFLSHIANIEFLVIDGIHWASGGHNMPPDHVCINSVFHTRRIKKYPTIFICSSSFIKKIISDPTMIGDKYGKEFVDCFLCKDNVKIGLEAENA